MSHLRRAGALALAAAFAFTVPAAASTHKSDIDAKIRAQRERIGSMQQRLELKHAELQSARAKVGTLQQQLDVTNRNISQVGNRLAEIEGRVRWNERRLAWNRTQLEAAQATLRRHDDALRRRLVDAYEHGEMGYVEVLLASKSFSDFVQRWNLIRFVIRQNQSTIRARRADERHVAGIRRDLMGLANVLQSEEDAARQQRLALAALASQRQGLLAAAVVEKQTVAAQVAELEEENAQAEAALEGLVRQKQQEEEERRAAARRAAQLAGAELPPAAGAPSQLAWPASGPITSPFGMRTNPVTHNFILHGGIDIGVPTGTTVTAAADGKVILNGWDPGGCGNFIEIDHGGHLATEYCHLSQSYVGVGQDVQRGQAIAASGSTGNSTGPHLHFGVRLDGKPVDPMSYLR